VSKSKAPSPPDLEARERNLRSQTCAFLKLGAFETLRPAEMVRVDLIGSLREEIRDLRMAQLAGRTDVDIARLVEAGKQLSSLLDGQPPEASSSLAEARARLKQVLLGIEPDLEDPNRPPTETERLRQENAELREQLTELTERLAAPAPAREDRSNVVELDANARKPPPHYLRQASEPWRDHVEGRGAGAQIAPYFNCDNPPTRKT
jgi:hypothetical protein